ncbi:uncharacterized protein LOC112552868, partial [Pogonomyrmex barbatus]|uniref:Dynein regulatory complex subunit 2 n=1 Tax=Pogonomyrmex barbatus TaxID=144034 RepID=A0A8N1S870_9HYME
MLKKKQLMREIELGALNTKRYRTLWREMMMRIKMPQITENVEIAWRNFDRALDIKDYRISFLMDELAEAEEQYQRNARSHIEIIDRLLNSYTERIECEKRNYQRILNETLKQMNGEINKIYHEQNEAEILLQSITRNVQLQLEDSLNNTKSIALSKPLILYYNFILSELLLLQILHDNYIYARARARACVYVCVYVEQKDSELSEQHSIYLFIKNYIEKYKSLFCFTLHII